MPCGGFRQGVAQLTVKWGRMVVVAFRSIVVPVKGIEPAICGCITPATEPLVPLAHHVSGVARLLEESWQCSQIQWQSVGLFGVDYFVLK